MSRRLPFCYHTKPYITPEEGVYHTQNDEEYSKLIDIIKKNVGSDCRGFAINDEIIFNSYQESDFFTQQLTENNYREQIMKDPHSSILVHLNRSDKDAKIYIYMFPFTECYLLQIDYFSRDKTYTIKMFYSTQYVEKYSKEFKEDYIQEDEDTKNKNLTKIQLACIRSKSFVKRNRVVIKPQNKDDYILISQGLEKYYSDLEVSYKEKEGEIIIHDLSERSYIYCGAVEKKSIMWMEDYIPNINY